MKVREQQWFGEWRKEESHNGWESRPDSAVRYFMRLYHPVFLGADSGLTISDDSCVMLSSRLTHSVTCCRLSPVWWCRDPQKQRDRQQSLRHGGLIDLFNYAFRQPLRPMCGKT